MNVMLHTFVSLWLIFFSQIIAERTVTIEVPREQWNTSSPMPAPNSTTTSTPWTTTPTTPPSTTSTTPIPTTTTPSTTTTEKPSCGPAYDHILKGWVENIFYTGHSEDGIVCYIAVVDESSPLNLVYHASFSHSLCDRAEFESQRSLRTELWSISDKVRGIPVAVGLQRAGWQGVFRCNV